MGVLVVGWPEPKIAANVNTKELGKLNLTSDQEDAIVAFLKTLSDGYVPSQSTSASMTEGSAVEETQLFLPMVNNHQ